MKIGILQIISGECISDEVGVDVNRVAYELGKHGYFVQCSVTVCDTDKISDSFGFLCATCDAVTVCGAVNAFYDAVAEKYELSRRLSTFLLGNVPCAGKMRRQIRCGQPYTNVERAVQNLLRNQRVSHFGKDGRAIAGSSQRLYQKPQQDIC